MFKNRKDAGLQLAKKLDFYKNDKPVILGIARGGVETGYYIAQELQCEFSVLIVRKLGFHSQPEAAFGALAEGGSLYLNPSAKNLLSEKEIEQVIQKETEEIQRRIQAYREGKPLPELKDRTVILVDDGIATGATLYAAIELCWDQQVESLIVAAPVSGIGIKDELQSMVDEVLILEKPDDYFAVSQAYEEFRNLTDEDVISFLKKRNKSAKEAAGPGLE